MCQSSVALDREDSKEEGLKDIGEGEMSVLSMVKMIRNSFGMDVHTKVLYPSFLGVLIHTSGIATPHL